MPWNTNLSGTPLNIAAYTGAQLRVVAGPGTGKTYALMRRVARLLEQNVQPNRVLAISFTRTAANDLVHKLAQLGVQGVDDGRVFLSERTELPLEPPRHWFDPALEEAKISGFHWHDLRHTFASRLRMKGTPLEDIADLLGRKGLAMTRRYAHLGPSRLHEVVARLVEKPVKTGTKSGTVARRPAIHSVVNYLN